MTYMIIGGCILSILFIYLIRLIILKGYGKYKMRFVFTIVPTGKKVKTDWIWKDIDLIDTVFESLNNTAIVPFKIDSVLTTNMFSNEVIQRSFIEVQFKKAFLL